MRSQRRFTWNWKPSTSCIWNCRKSPLQRRRENLRLFSALRRAQQALPIISRRTQQRVTDAAIAEAMLCWRPVGDWAWRSLTPGLSRTPDGFRLDVDRHMETRYGMATDGDSAEGWRKRVHARDVDGNEQVTWFCDGDWVYGAGAKEDRDEYETEEWVVSTEWMPRARSNAELRAAF